MTEATRLEIEDIRKQTELIQLERCNYMHSLLCDTFMFWEVIDNKHSGYVTVTAQTSKKAKPKTYVLSPSGLLLNGKKIIKSVDDFLIDSKYVFNDYLTS